MQKAVTSVRRSWELRFKETQTYTTLQERKNSQKMHNITSGLTEAAGNGMYDARWNKDSPVELPVLLLLSLVLKPSLSSDSS